MSNYRPSEPNHCFSHLNGDSPANPTYVFNNLKFPIPRSDPDFKLITISQLRNIFSYIEAQILNSKAYNIWQIELSFSSPVIAQPKIYLEEGSTVPPPGSPQSEGNDNTSSALTNIHNEALSTLAWCEVDEESPRNIIPVTPKAQRFGPSENHKSPLAETSRGIKTVPPRKRSKPENLQTCQTVLAPRSKITKEAMPINCAPSLLHPEYLMPKALAGLESDQNRIQATEKKLRAAQQDLLAKKASELVTKPASLANGRNGSDLCVSQSSSLREPDPHDLRPLRPLRPYKSHGQSNSLHSSKTLSNEPLTIPRSKKSTLVRGHSHQMPAKRSLPRCDSLLDRASDDLEACWSSQPDPSPIASPVGSPLLDSTISRSNSFIPCPVNASGVSVDNPASVSTKTDSTRKRKLSHLMPRPKTVDLKPQGSTSTSIQKPCISDPPHPSSPPPSN
ncbi:hypothetical protein DSO57_1021947 [Entomophthora muscae]|uniref:Uncharacterized protein n=1 Tax=Entomophthora muscae TaxID=34485 RepID=A0ACC2S5A4_9FUNG|nr:hypothetical protein DSO57_1021947 [Entomophthora muscae]